MPISPNQPWYRRTTRWGQTNITEIDPSRYDLNFWREHWRRTRLQGVILNAGGIVAYYPSALPLTYHAEFLNGRDLFGDLVQAARADGLSVLARMDSNRVHENVYFAHPDWIAVDGEGRPYRAGGLYVTSVDSPYYEDYLPSVLREIAGRYRPDGFTDNSFSGLGRESIDYNPHAARRFLAATGRPLPRRKDWNDPAYRQWIEWSYARRLEIWEINNRTVREAGGPDCLWIGMVGSDPIGQGASFRDLRGIAQRAEMLLLDSQSRPVGAAVTAPGSFKANSEAGHLLHNLLGWDKLIPESMAMYEHSGGAPFRLASKPEPEARLWVVAGLAGGIQPWWHHIGAAHEDRRQYRTAESLWQWHAEHEEYLLNRQPVAPLGVVWSQRNADFYGRDEARLKVDHPWQGLTRALLAARIPYQPVHADDLPAAIASGQLSALALPNVGALSDAQLATVRAFVEAGGGLLASGESGRYDEWGDPRADWALGELLGVQHSGAGLGSFTPGAAGWEDWSQHSYLRLEPDGDMAVYGPRMGQPPVGETSTTGASMPLTRHVLLEGFELTNLLPFGGRLEAVTVADAQVPARFVPPCPVYPPETSWMRDPRGTLPALVAQERGARTVYFAADIDRCYARNPLPDYARLLANAARWVLGDHLPLRVEGAGLLDCRLFLQEANGRPRWVLHLVNLSGTEPRPVAEFLPVGPLRVRLNLPRLNLPRQNLPTASARLLVAGQSARTWHEDGWLCLDVARVVDHEVVVVE